MRLLGKIWYSKLREMALSAIIQTYTESSNLKEDEVRDLLRSIGMKITRENITS